MREMKILIYSTFAFMLYFMLASNFVTLMSPSPEVQTITIKKMHPTVYYFTPEDHTVTGKFYNNDGYFLVVYNEKSKDFDIKEVEEEIWRKKEIGKPDYYDKSDYYY